MDSNVKVREGLWLNYLSLITSGGTLVCCALPALLVSLGMGAVLAGLVSQFPQLVWLSENKLIVFAAAGIMLMISGISIWYSRNLPCPVDPQLRDSCIKGRRYSKLVFIVSLGIYMIGVVFAFILPLLKV